MNLAKCLITTTERSLECQGLELGNHLRPAGRHVGQRERLEGLRGNDRLHRQPLPGGERMKLASSQVRAMHTHAQPRCSMRWRRR